MKLYLGIAGFLVTMISCQQNGSKAHNDDNMNETDSASTSTHTLDDGHYCYILTEGNNNQDTTKVHFVINTNEVTGEMNWLPYEKDSRKGTLQGNINGEHVDVKWAYMQEGMNDTLHLQFRLTSGMELYQKPLKVNSNNQREETDESADYSVKYAAIDCK